MYIHKLFELILGSYILKKGVAVCMFSMESFKHVIKLQQNLLNILQTRKNLCRGDHRFGLA